MVITWLAIISASLTIIVLISVVGFALHSWMRIEDPKDTELFTSYLLSDLLHEHFQLEQWIIIV